MWLPSGGNDCRSTSCKSQVRNSSLLCVRSNAEIARLSSASYQCRNNYILVKSASFWYPSKLQPLLHPWKMCDMHRHFFCWTTRSTTRDLLIILLSWFATLCHASFDMPSKPSLQTCTRVFTERWSPSSILSTGILVTLLISGKLNQSTWWTTYFFKIIYAT